MAITTTARSTPRNAAMTGIATWGRPPPVAPLMNAPTEMAETMTTRSTASAPLTAGPGAAPSCRPVQAGQDELPVAEHLGGGPPPGRRPHDDLLGQVGGLVQRHVLGDDAGHVQVDVFRHRRGRARVSGELENRDDRVADDVALPGREQVQCGTAGDEERDRLSGG